MGLPVQLPGHVFDACLAHEEYVQFNKGTLKFISVLHAKSILYMFQNVRLFQFQMNIHAAKKNMLPPLNSFFSFGL